MNVDVDSISHNPGEAGTDTYTFSYNYGNTGTNCIADFTLTANYNCAADDCPTDVFITGDTIGETPNFLLNDFDHSIVSNLA